MKYFLTVLLLLNVILSTLWACGSGPKPEHYGVYQATKNTSLVANVTNSVAITTNQVSAIK
jgi:hypothetical protein